MKVSTENDNNFGYEKIKIVVDNIPLMLQSTIELFNFSSNFNGFFFGCKVIILLGYWWILKHFCNFISKRGLKGVQIKTFCIIWRFIEYWFLIQFWCKFFIWIDWAESFQYYDDGFVLSFVVSEIISTDMGQQKPNSKIWTFLF
jgi:hypothetical protein